MREIKFRVWDAREKQMLEVNHLFNLDNKQPIEVWTNYYEGGYRFNPDKSELMQYTGLDDVHGVKIYEGDIVKWGDQPNGHESPIRIGVVELNPDIQFITNAGIFIFEYGRFAYKETNKYLTILGNRFEKPELLETVL